MPTFCPSPREWCNTLRRCLDPRNPDTPCPGGSSTTKDLGFIDATTGEEVPDSRLLPNISISDEDLRLSTSAGYARAIRESNDGFSVWVSEVITNLRNRGFSIQKDLAGSQKGHVDEVSGVPVPDFVVIHLTKEGLTSKCGLNFAVWETNPNPRDGANVCENGWIARRHAQKRSAPPVELGSDSPILLPTGGLPEEDQPGVIGLSVSETPIEETVGTGTDAGPGIPSSLPSKEVASMALFDQIKALEMLKMKTTVLDFDQHNWFFSQVTGSPAPNPEQFGIARVTPMPNISIESWWSTIGPTVTGIEADRFPVEEGRREIPAPGDTPGTPVQGGALAQLTKTVAIGGVDIPIWGIGLALIVAIRVAR